MIALQKLELSSPSPPKKSTNALSSSMGSGMKVRNLQPLAQSMSSPNSRMSSRERHRLTRPASPAFQRAFTCGDSLNRVSLTAPSSENRSLRSIMPAQKWDLDGVQLAKLQRLVRKTHEKQLRNDPSKRPNRQPRVVLKLVAMEELVRDEFVKNRINTLPYNIVNYLCTIGDEHRLRIELAAGMYNVNQRDGATGRTALICAIVAGHLPIVRMLVLEHQADVNRPSLLGRTTPLHFAVAGNFRQIASTLITFGADVHATNIVGATPLHLAHSIGLIKLLLRFHANPIHRSAEGLTPLEFYRKYTRLLPEERAQEVEELFTQAEDEAVIRLFKADTSLAHLPPPAITAGRPVAQSSGAKAFTKFATKR